MGPGMVSVSDFTARQRDESPFSTKCICFEATSVLCVADAVHATLAELRTVLIDLIYE